MVIQYIGGRSRVKVSPNRKSYNFTPENNRTLDIKEQNIIDYIFSLPNRAEFRAIESQVIPVREISDEEDLEVEPTKNKPGRPKKGY